MKITILTSASRCKLVASYKRLKEICCLRLLGGCTYPCPCASKPWTPSHTSISGRHRNTGRHRAVTRFLGVCR